LSKQRTTKRSPQIIRDSGDEEQVKKTMAAEKDQEYDLTFIMSAPRGRRWLYGMIFNTCHVSSISHVPGDTHSTAFNEGARAVGETLLEELRSQHHALYIKMLEENDARDE
jgi:hypothetical protein